MKKSVTYGEWQVTDAEYLIARQLSIDNDGVGQAAYQLVRYCRGAIYDRALAELALHAIRTSPKGDRK